MFQQKAKDTLSKLQNACREAVETAKTASRNGKSLSGHNFYGDKFHTQVVEISAYESELENYLAGCLNENDFNQLKSFLSSIKSTSLPKKQRIDCLKGLGLLCQSKIVSQIENTKIDSTPKTEQVLPFEVVQGTRNYLENMVVQANGCYEHGWYEACSVMIRKFVETMIIEVFESKGESHEIKDADNNFYMLEKLINNITAKTSWNLQRDTKKSLPEIKALGDKSAHSRRYLCTKPDVDKILSGLRAVTDDLLHLANLK